MMRLSGQGPNKGFTKNGLNPKGLKDHTRRDEPPRSQTRRLDQDLLDSGGAILRGVEDVTFTQKLAVESHVEPLVVIE